MSTQSWFCCTKIPFTCLFLNKATSFTHVLCFIPVLEVLCLYIDIALIKLEMTHVCVHSHTLIFLFTE